MGKLFELISDKALENALKQEKSLNKALGYSDLTECDVCGKFVADTFPYNGTQYDDDGNALDSDYDPSNACADCILAGKVTHICDWKYIETIGNYLDTQNLSAEEKEIKTERLIEKYQRTPDIPIFMQYHDIPLCCGDITEFIGHPESNEELYEISDYNYWEKGLKSKSEYENFRKYGKPESYIDVAAFQCSHCGKKYFTFQFT